MNNKPLINRMSVGRFAPLLVGCSLLLGGCGFHLRGAVELPPAMEAAQITGVPAGNAIYGEIRRTLVAAGGGVVSDPEQASARLEVLGEDFDRRVLSVDSTGKVSEYELTYRLRYRLLAPNGEVLVAPQSINMTRDYRYNTANVLGTEEEATQLQQEMRRLAVRQMLRRLRLTMAHPEAAGETAR